MRHVYGRTSDSRRPPSARAHTCAGATLAPPPPDACDVASMTMQLLRCSHARDMPMLDDALSERDQSEIGPPRISVAVWEALGLTPALFFLHITTRQTMTRRTPTPAPAAMPIRAP